MNVVHQYDCDGLLVAPVGPHLPVGCNLLAIPGVVGAGRAEARVVTRTRERLAWHGAPAHAERDHRLPVAGRFCGRRGCLVLVGLALLVAGCGANRSTPARSPQRGGPASTSSAAASSPTLTITPGSGLTGGQELRVRLAGFPERATVMVYECAAAPEAGGSRGCGGAASSYLYTGRAGSASGVFTAQPAAGTGANGTGTRCRQQCVIVGRVIKLGAGLPPNPAPMATAPLSFSGTAVPGLAYSQLADLSWVSATDGWALAAQPCASGTCARLARTTDGGVHWQPLPDPPARLQDGTVDCSKVACVSGVRFASPAVGYLYGPALLMTSDGGRTWREQQGPQVETLTIVGSQVYRVAYGHTGCPAPAGRPCSGRRSAPRRGRRRSASSLRRAAAVPPRSSPPAQPCCSPCSAVRPARCPRKRSSTARPAAEALGSSGPTRAPAGEPAAGVRRRT